MKNTLIFSLSLFIFAVLLASCGSTKQIATKETPVTTFVDYKNFPDSVITENKLQLPQLQKLQLYLGNLENQPLVLQRNTGNPTSKVEDGRLILVGDGSTETIQFDPAEKGQLIAFDFSKRQAKVSFEEGDDTKFLTFGLNSEGNYTLYTMFKGGKKYIKWGAYEYEVMSDPKDLELFYDSNSLDVGYEKVVRVSGRSVTDPINTVDQKKKKN